jgi:FtsP/CotA-like multicopper oxidase with cupredoxin domain
MPDGNFDFNGAIGLTPDPSVSDDPACAAASPPSHCANGLDGHVDPRAIMDVGVMNGSQPAPLMAIDEDDEFFLTLTNVGQVMRPDLFEQHTVHFHGYPNASAFYDGVPDASVAINIGGSFTYYYLAPDAGTYFWHCHITPPEHLEMGMVGQLFVRPRQNRLIGNLRAALVSLETPPANPTSPTSEEYERLRKRCGADILCATPIPAANVAINNGGRKYAYNDGDGSTAYDVEYPLQMHGFDPNFHFVGMTFNPESFVDLKDKYFLLNGRSYPDTVGGYTCGPGDTLPACSGKSAGAVVPGPMQTQATDGTLHSSQPMPSVINIPAGGRALLRISDLNVTEFHTLASLGIPMRVIAINARLLRDQDGQNMAYNTNSITLGGGESLDVILDATGYAAGQKFYLYTPQLDHLSNDAENFGGMMTEVNVCTTVDPITKVGTGCPST